MAIVTFGLFAAEMVTGCGGDQGPARAAVCGSVSLDGRPLASGMIRFIPTGANIGPAAAATITGGVYELPQAAGPVIGAHRVEIEATDYYGFAIDDEAAYVTNVEQKGGRLPLNPVPPIYNRHTMLTAQVTAEGENQFDFQLSSQGLHTAGR